MVKAKLDPPTGRRRAPADSLRVRRAAGFTLIEILLAATLGALLLVATASSAGLFGKQLEYLKEQQDASLDTALAKVNDDLRYAWWADAPDPRQLILADPQGAQTIYAFSSGKLTVKRPDGSTGTVLDDLKSVSFTEQTLTRYREAPADKRNGQFWSAAAPGGALVQVKVIDVGDKLALGFCPTSPAPIAGTTPGIQDQLLDSTLASMSLIVATVGGVSTLTGGLTVDLFRARAPHDARPEGSSLGTLTISSVGMPVAAAIVQNKTTKKKINVPGGAAWGWWKSNSKWELVVTPPTVGVPIDLAPLAAKVKPGYSYTLVLGATGSGKAVAVYPVASATKSGVAFNVAGAGYVAQALAMPRSISGEMNMTRTTATDVTNRVLVSIESNDGGKVSGSTLVLGQAMADDTWLGVVPGEYGP